MGAWGFYDDENDCIHDEWSSFLGDVDQHDNEKIFDKLQKYVEKKNITGSVVVGMIMMAFKHVNNPNPRFGFGTRIAEIASKIDKTLSTDDFHKYKIENQIAKKINKNFLKKIVDNITQLKNTIDDEGWSDTQQRLECLKKEENYLLSIINDTS